MNVLKSIGIVLTVMTLLAVPALAQDAVAKAMAMAPADGQALIHLDVEAIYPDLEKSLKAEADNLGEDTPIVTILETLKTIKTIDIYVIMPSEGMAMPTVYGVIRGKLTRGQVSKLMGEMGGTPEGESLDLVAIEGEKGRYQVPASMLYFIDGNEADDIDADVMMVSFGPILTPDFLATLGKADNAILPALLNKIDTKAPIWGAAQLDGQNDPNAPEKLYGSMDPRGMGKVDFTAIFKNEDAVKKMLDDVNDDEGVVSAFLQAKADALAVNLTLKPSKLTMAQRFTNGVKKARTLAKRAASMSNLRGMGSGIALYAGENNDQMPATLDVLVESKFISKKMLKSPSAEGKKIEEPHYIYKPLPTSAPGNLVIAWEKPEINDNEGTNVLFADVHVEWMTMEDFKAALEKTEKWRAENK